MKFERDYDGKWKASLTTTKEIETAIKNDMPITADGSPINAIRKARVEHIYSNSDMQRIYGGKETGWLVDISTRKTSYSKFDKRGHWFYSSSNIIDDDGVVFQRIQSICDSNRQKDGVLLITVNDEVIRTSR